MCPVVKMSCRRGCCRHFSDAFNKTFRENINWLKNGSDLNLRPLSSVNVGGAVGKDLVSSGTKFLLANVLPTFFDASVRKCRGIINWLTNVSALKLWHLSSVNKGYRRWGFGVQWYQFLAGERVADIFL